MLLIYGASFWAPEGGIFGGCGDPSAEGPAAYLGRAGGDRAASISTLLQTAKLNGVNPEAYPRDALAKIGDGHPNNKVDELMPWRMAHQALSYGKAGRLRFSHLAIESIRVSRHRWHLPVNIRRSKLRSGTV
jgi:hypothetical protein